MSESTFIRKSVTGIDCQFNYDGQLHIHVIIIGQLWYFTDGQLQ